MRSGDESPHLGTRVLGPHVVGQRVVIRRIIPGETGPSGGPAMTDLLGICLAWTEDSCVVQPESGPPVTIPLDLVVSGKPVPPRPSVRLRVSAREAEGHVLALFPGVEAHPLGGWLLRTVPVPVGRPRRRANSCLAMGDPGLPFAEAEAVARAFYDERGRDRLVQVEAGSEWETAFLDAGWSPLGSGDAHFQLASVASVRRRLGAATSARETDPTAVAELDESEGETARTATVRIRHLGHEIASGSATLEDDWLALHDVVVDPGHRRRGLAHDVLAELLEWGAEQGASTTWLHVETDNDAALALYDGLGFTTHHTGRYLRG